jgi:hypothetical protein
MLTVVSDSRSGSHFESNVLRRRDVLTVRMTLHRVRLVVFEEADRFLVSRRDFVGVESSIDVFGVGGTVVSLNELESVRSEALLR